MSTPGGSAGGGTMETRRNPMQPTERSSPEYQAADYSRGVWLSPTLRSEVLKTQSTAIPGQDKRYEVAFRPSWVPVATEDRLRLALAHLDSAWLSRPATLPAASQLARRWLALGLL